MEPITGNNRRIVEDCITFARQFLLLPETIELYFDDCPSQRFPTMRHAAESNRRVIFFNKPWFRQRISRHRDDLEFFIFHELRHIHQLESVRRKLCGEPYDDAPEVVDAWQQGFDGYVRNTGDATQNTNVTQEIEIDANAYGICLTNLLHLNDSVTLQFSMPKEASALADPRSREYYASQPKIRQYLEQHRTAPTPAAPVRKAGKIMPNDPCPCGSGVKYKHCCRGRGIYE